MEIFDFTVLVIAGIWTFFRASVWCYWRQSARLERLFEALEIGVVTAWVKVVKPYMEKNGDGAPLPADIRERAETLAVAEAIKTDPIVRKFSDDVVRATLKMAVEEAKRRGGK
jgi:hypothetical protein